ncbi:MAG: hypothetical protein ABI978_01705 [Chloroflexota bacterium]
MAEVITFVLAEVDDDHASQIATSLQAVIDGGLPPQIEETFLLRGPEDAIAILTAWRTRDDLDRMLASSDEPVARRLMRQAGGTPTVTIYTVLVPRSHATIGPLRA